MNRKASSERDASRANDFDALLLAVLGNRFESIVREMTNTLQRAAYSSIISIARDFSCSIVTAQNQLLVAAEGLPVHVYGSHLQTEAMCRLHVDLAEGDAFLHNDVYLGNSHAADHSILVPIFVNNEHVFTANAKGHLADIGNALPTTYMAAAKDVYEEGALVFPCVRIQREYRDIEDVIRMCRARIRVPDQWFGDYMAMLGAARVAERRVKELAEKYGMETLKAFVRRWFDYSERRMVAAIQRLPSGTITGHGHHDPFPGVPDGFPLTVKVTVDAKAGSIVADLRENIDCVPAGINSSVACAVSSVIHGTLSALDPDIPHNAGSFKRVSVLLRENCIAGIPRFPHSCSLATTDPANRLINLTQSTFARLASGLGAAEGGTAQNVGFAVISGSDARRDGAPYVNQLVLGSNGGPASATADGWITYSMPAISGLLYRDSVEIDEQRFPILVRRVRIVRDTGGAGKFRGAPGVEVEYGPRFDPMMVTFPADGHFTPARGVRGGLDGSRASAVKIDSDTAEKPLPNVFAGPISPGEFVRGVDCSGAGYGDPYLRDPDLVRRDVMEDIVSIESARDVYGVVVVGDYRGTLRVDTVATAAHRARRNVFEEPANV